MVHLFEVSHVAFISADSSGRLMLRQVHRRDDTYSTILGRIRIDTNFQRCKQEVLDEVLLELGSD
jgi:hypothetical protein